MSGRTLTEHEVALMESYGPCPHCDSPLTTRVTMDPIEREPLDFMDVVSFVAPTSRGTQYTVTIATVCIWNGHTPS